MSGAMPTALRGHAFQRHMPTQSRGHGTRRVKTTTTRPPAIGLILAIARPPAELTAWASCPPPPGWVGSASSRRPARQTVHFFPIPRRFGHARPFPSLTRRVFPEHTVTADAVEWSRVARSTNRGYRNDAISPSGHPPWFRGAWRTCRTVAPSGSSLKSSRSNSRDVPAVSAVFAGGALAVFGDNSDNTITLSRTAAGNILVNGGAVRVLGGTPTVANTFSITVVRPGRERHDRAGRGERRAAVGDPVRRGRERQPSPAGRRSTCCTAGPATTRCSARAGQDILFGGVGNDALTGGAGNDLAFGEAGDDVLVWNPGDGSDLNDGGAGRDETRFNGNDVDETFELAANGPRARLTRDVGGIVMDLNGVEVVTVNALGGADTVAVNDLSGTGVTDVNLNLSGGWRRDRRRRQDGHRDRQRHGRRRQRLRGRVRRRHAGVRTRRDHLDHRDGSGRRPTGGPRVGRGRRDQRGRAGRRRDGLHRGRRRPGTTC